MKRAFLLAAVALGASAANINGTWRAVFVNGDEPKGMGEVILDLQAVGGRLTGTAYLGAVAREATLIDGKVDGDRVTFTAYGKTVSWSKSASGEEASGVAKLTFVGTVKGDEIHFTMHWGNVMLYGKPWVGRDRVLRATRKTD